MADNTTYNDLVGFTTGTDSGIVSNPRNIGDVMNNLAIRVMAETKKQLNEKVTGETSNALESSIQMPIKIFGTSYVATLSMLSYYDYINQGVEGAGGKIKTGKNKGKDWVVISQGSDYKYSTKPPPLKKGGLKYFYSPLKQEDVEKEIKPLNYDTFKWFNRLYYFDDNRIVYTHAVHRNYNYKSLVLKAIDKGKF